GDVPRGAHDDPPQVLARDIYRGRGANDRQLNRQAFLGCHDPKCLWNFNLRDTIDRSGGSAEVGPCLGTLQSDVANHFRGIPWVRLNKGLYSCSTRVSVGEDPELGGPEQAFVQVLTEIVDEFSADALVFGNSENTPIIFAVTPHSGREEGANGG